MFTFQVKLEMNELMIHLKYHLKLIDEFKCVEKQFIYFRIILFKKDNDYISTRMN